MTNEKKAGIMERFENFEMNAKDVNTMTSDEFDRYIKGIYNQWEV